MTAGQCPPGNRTRPPRGRRVPWKHIPLQPMPKISVKIGNERACGLRGRKGTHCGGTERMLGPDVPPTRFPTRISRGTRSRFDAPECGPTRTARQDAPTPLVRSSCRPTRSVGRTTLACVTDDVRSTERTLPPEQVFGGILPRDQLTGAGDVRASCGPSADTSETATLHRSPFNGSGCWQWDRKSATPMSERLSSERCLGPRWRF